MLPKKRDEFYSITMSWIRRKSFSGRSLRASLHALEVAEHLNQMVKINVYQKLQVIAKQDVSSKSK